MTLSVFALALVIKRLNAADLIRQIEAVKTPTLTATTDEAIAKWEKDCDEAGEKRGALIWSLYSDYPGNSEVPKYLNVRWTDMVGHRKPCALSRLDRLDTDLQKFLANLQIRESAEFAKFWVAKSKIWREWKLMRDANLKPVDDGAKPYLKSAFAAADGLWNIEPGFQDGAYLYFDLSEMTKGTPDEIRALKDIARRYPHQGLAEAAVGRVRALSSLDKPFALRFKDVKSGQLVDIKDYRGKVVLLDFWATWCAPCRLDIEGDLMTLAKSQPGLAVIGITLDVPEDKGGRKMVLDYLNQKGIPWPNLYDGKGQSGGFASECGVLGIPAQFLIDKQGVLRSITAGDDRERLVKQYLGS